MEWFSVLMRYVNGIKTLLPRYCVNKTQIENVVMHVYVQLLSREEWECICLQQCAVRANVRGDLLCPFNLPGGKSWMEVACITCNLRFSISR